MDNLSITQKIWAGLLYGPPVWICLIGTILLSGKVRSVNLGNTTTNNYITHNYGELGDKAIEKAEKYGIDPPLFLALISQESAWNPDAVSPVGARGLTQVMPATAATECGIDDPDDLFDPDVNLDCGAFYLAKMLRLKGGDVSLALAGYNAGPGNAERALKKFPETKRYVANILANYEGGQ